MADKFQKILLMIMVSALTIITLLLIIVIQGEHNRRGISDVLYILDHYEFDVRP